MDFSMGKTKKSKAGPRWNRNLVLLICSIQTKKWARHVQFDVSVSSSIWIRFNTYLLLDQIPNYGMSKKAQALN